MRFFRRLDAYGTSDPDFNEGHPEDRCPLCGEPVDLHPCWRHRIAAAFSLFIDKVEEL